MDQGKLAIIADKTMDIVLFLALLALIAMTVIEIRKRRNANRRKRLNEKQIEAIMRSVIMPKSECEKTCGTFNTDDHDCEIFGESHPRPVNCPYFIPPDSNQLINEKRGTECQN